MMVLFKFFALISTSVTGIGGGIYQLTQKINLFASPESDLFVENDDNDFQYFIKNTDNVIESLTSSKEEGEGEEEIDISQIENIDISEDNVAESAVYKDPRPDLKEQQEKKKELQNTKETLETNLQDAQDKLKIQEPQTTSLNVSSPKAPDKNASVTNGSSRTITINNPEQRECLQGLNSAMILSHSNCGILKQ